MNSFKLSILTAHTGNLVYVFNTINPSMTNTSGGTTQFISTSITGAFLIGVTPNGKFAYVTTTSSVLYVMGGLTLKPIASMPITNSTDAKVSPDGTKVYVTTGPMS